MTYGHRRGGRKLFFLTAPQRRIGRERVADFNVAVIGGEQMYQALRSMSADTQLILYPGANHGVTTPSHVRDRMERYLAWCAKTARRSNLVTALYLQQ